MYMIMFVSKTFEQASEVLDVWVKAGVQGLTIVESAGMQQVGGGGGIRSDLGIVFSLKHLMRAEEIHHRTFFSVVKDEAMVERIVQATTEYVGDWSSPDVGVLFVWPIAKAYGMEKHAPAAN